MDSDITACQAFASAEFAGDSEDHDSQHTELIVSSTFSHARTALVSGIGLEGSTPPVHKQHVSMSKEANNIEPRDPENTTNPFQHRIPPELLIYIFELCLRLRGSNEFIHISGPRCRDIRSPALTLSHVCSRWRSLALSTSALWGNISIRIVNPLTTPQDRAMLRVLKMHFERSRDSPIELCLRSTYHSGTVSEMLSSSSSSTHYLARLQRLELEMTHITSIPGIDITNNSEVVFPELHSLSFAGGPLEGLKQISFPKLRQVTISTFVFHGSMTSDLHLPWRQLTSLTFACSMWIDVTRILNDCPGLVFLNIHIYMSKGFTGLKVADPNAFQTVTLNHLEHLTLHLITHHTYKSATRLLNTLICPSLSILSFQGVQEGVENDFDEAVVTRLIHRSQCQHTLRTLVIDSIPISETSLLGILRMTPCLTLLSFSETRFKPAIVDGTLFAAMTALPSAEDKLVPDLRDIRIVLRGRYGSSGIPLREFYEMVRSRIDVLHSVVIDFGRRSEIPKADLDALRELQERHCDVALKVMAGCTVLLGYGK